MDIKKCEQKKSRKIKATLNSKCDATAATAGATHDNNGDDVGDDDDDERTHCTTRQEPLTQTIHTLC